MSILKSFRPPTGLPKDSPSALWSLQLLLDSYAQDIFGQRSPDKKIYQPTFSSKPTEQPCVYNTKDEDGGYAQLSVNASTCWQATVYELAHETIHLLEPRPAPPYGKGSNWFEEGVAVEFSLHCTGLTFGITHPVKSPKYVKARNLVLKMGKQDLFEKCRKIRQECGHFADATIEAFTLYAPTCDERIAKRLIERFDETPLVNA